MITLGIDVGNKTTKLVLWDGSEILSDYFSEAGEAEICVKQGMEEITKKAGVSSGDIGYTVCTGANRYLFENNGMDELITDMVCLAKGVTHQIPGARTLIDIGCEGSQAARVNENGEISDFALNEKCASGTGLFLESMARKLLHVKVEELGEISLKSKNKVELNNMCAVFAESDVITLVHKKIPIEDIVKGLHDAVAMRVNTMIKSIGMEPMVVMTGGVARNIGVVDSLSRGLGVEITVPDRPEMMGALGAAIYAQEKLSNME